LQTRPISRIELTEITGCSAGTVSNHVRTLIKKGFVIETKKGISSGGRKPIQLMINPNKANSPLDTVFYCKYFKEF